jgi:hypothetical protein
MTVVGLAGMTVGGAQMTVRGCTNDGAGVGGKGVVGMPSILCVKGTDCLL